MDKNTALKAAVTIKWQLTINTRNNSELAYPQDSHGLYILARIFVTPYFRMLEYK